MVCGVDETFIVVSKNNWRCSLLTATGAIKVCRRLNIRQALQPLQRINGLYKFNKEA